MVQAVDYDHQIQDQQDMLPAIKLLGEINSNLKQVTDLVEGMLQRVKSGEVTTKYGLSFLEVKYHMLLDYMINLTYIVLRKCTGESIEGDPSIERLIEIRTVLENIRPIDYKLRYEIDKLVKTATTGATNISDPTHYKPNPKDMLININQAGSMCDDDGNESAFDHIYSNAKDINYTNSDEENNVNKSAVKKLKKPAIFQGKSGIYVPPKIKPVYYDGDEKHNDKERKIFEQANKRTITASILQDLKEEYLDAPKEISTTSKAQQIYSKAQKEKQEFEESYMTRVPVSKTEKHRQHKLTTLGTLGDEILGHISREARLRGDTTAIRHSKKRFAKGNRGKKITNKNRKFY